jgi:hypothetical protein
LAIAMATSMGLWLTGICQARVIMFDFPSKWDVTKMTDPRLINRLAFEIGISSFIIKALLSNDPIWIARILNPIFFHNIVINYIPPCSIYKMGEII